MRRAVIALAVLCVAAGPARAVGERVAEVREVRGLTAPTWSPELHRTAEGYARWIMRSHRFEHGGCYRVGLAFEVCGEVLAAARTTTPARAVVRAWLDSESHRAVVLGEWDRIGVGVANRHEHRWIVGLFLR